VTDSETDGHDATGHAYAPHHAAETNTSNKINRIYEVSQLYSMYSNATIGKILSN